VRLSNKLSPEQDPLIIAEGEIGDYDTDDEVPDCERIIQLTDAQAHHAALAATPAGASSAAGDHELSSITDPATETASNNAVETPPQPEQHKPAQAAGGTMSEGDEPPESEIDPEEAALLAELAEKFDEKRSPLSSVKCSICYDRPVQVALVPCGHSNVCRKCARRMEHCPYCRKPIARRQRLFLTGDS
jgi:hypothetical protein